jgi:hypothetical protein
MNVEPVDRGDELRKGVQSRLDRAPVVIRRPIAREFLSRRELYALRVIVDQFALRPSGRRDALAQFGKVRVRKFHMKRTNLRRLTARLDFSHDVGHTISPPENIEKTLRARGNGCRWHTAKVTVIEVELFLDIRAASAGHRYSFWPTRTNRGMRSLGVEKIDAQNYERYRRRNMRPWSSILLIEEEEHGDASQEDAPNDRCPSCCG